MQRSILFLSLMILYQQAEASETSVWDCGQSTNGKQWGCVSKSVDTADLPAESENPAPNLKSEESPDSTPQNEVRTAAPSEQPPTNSSEIPAASEATQTPANAEAPTAAPLTTPNSQTTGSQVTQIDKNSKNSAETYYDLGFRLLDPAFEPSQEQIFNNLRQRLKADPWAQCNTNPRAHNPYEAIPSSKQLRDDAAIDIESNYSEVFDKEVSSFYGDVSINRADQNILADKVNYNSFSGSVDAQGDVYYREDELSMYSDSVLLNMHTDEGRLRDTLFISPRAPIRGRAGVVYRESKDFSHYKDVTYTSCQPGNQDWVIHADRLKMNKATGKAAAKNAWLEFKGVPLFYTPYISFPMDKRRMTGFLNPTWSNSGQNGFDFIMPFYWNIAPNYDATFRPRYLVKRGMMLGTDLRYMNAWSNNQLSFDVLFNDEKETSEYYNQTRYQTRFKSDATLSPHMYSAIDVNYVSDDRYISELRHALSFTDFRHVRSVGDLVYQRPNVRFMTRAESFQTIDQSIVPSSRPYRKLPQVSLDLNHDFQAAPVKATLENEFVHFSHNFNVDGQRLNIKPSISAPINVASGFIIPKASLIHTNYFLNNDNVLSNRGVDLSNINLISSYNRDLPVLSLDSGLFAEAQYALGGVNFTHTLEPRLYYLYIPRSNQDALPVFDSAFYDTNFDNLFRENRFIGVDRVQNANQVTLALTSRFMDNSSGLERFKASIGNTIYFQDRDAHSVYSPSRHLYGIADPYIRFSQKETNNFSNVIGEFSGHLTNELSFTSALQWNPNQVDEKDRSLPRKVIDLHYRNASGFLLNAGYHEIYNRNLSILSYDTLSNNNNILYNANIKQSDVSARIPLFDNWYMVGRWQYSFYYDKTAESFLGLEKENCCWRFRIIGRKYINGLSVANPTVTPQDVNIFGQSQTAILFQLELKSLSAFGDDVNSFLKRNIYGYSDL